MTATYINNEGYSIDLPKFNGKISDLQDKVEQLKTTPNVTNSAIYKSMYEFVSAIFDKETLEKELNGNNFNDIDRIALSCMYIKIYNAYAKVIEDCKQEYEATKLNNPNVEKVTDMLNALKNIEALKDFQGKK